MDKIVEIILKDIVKRLEKLENSINKNTITEKQKSYIISLGGNPEGLNKQQAQELIEKLLSNKNSQRKELQGDGLL